MRTAVRAWRGCCPGGYGCARPGALSGRAPRCGGRRLWKRAQACRGRPRAGSTRAGGTGVPVSKAHASPTVLRCSCIRTKSRTSPRDLQPKHTKRWSSTSTKKLGLWSSWNGHSPCHRRAPARLSRTPARSIPWHLDASRATVILGARQADTSTEQAILASKQRWPAGVSEQGRLVSAPGVPGRSCAPRQRIYQRDALRSDCGRLEAFSAGAIVAICLSREAVDGAERRRRVDPRVLWSGEQGVVLRDLATPLRHRGPASASDID
jgi:hypothetical protein